MAADVNVTTVPAQTGFADAEIVMLTGRFGLTIIIMALELAGFPLAHTAFDVSMQVMTSPFTGT